MDMGLKYTLWKSAENAYSDKQYGTALKIYSSIGHLPQVLFNMSSIHLLKNDTGKAIECLTKAIAIDKKFAIAYYQRAVCFFFNQTYHRAIADFSSVRKLLKSKTVVDYSPAGLDFKIYMCEVLYNMAGCFRSLDLTEKSERLLSLAIRFAVNDSHRQIIESCTKLRRISLDIFTIETGLQFVPILKLKTLGKQDIPKGCNPKLPKGAEKNSVDQDSISSFTDEEKKEDNHQDSDNYMKLIRSKSLVFSHLSSRKNSNKEERKINVKESSTPMLKEKKQKSMLKIQFSTGNLVILLNQDAGLEELKRKVAYKLYNMGTVKYDRLCFRKNGYVVNTDKEFVNLRMKDEVLELTLDV